MLFAISIPTSLSRQWRHIHYVLSAPLYRVFRLLGRIYVPPVGKRHSSRVWLLSGCGANGAEGGESFVWKRQRCRLEIHAQMLKRRCAGNEQ